MITLLGEHAKQKGITLAAKPTAATWHCYMQSHRDIHVILTSFIDAKNNEMYSPTAKGMAEGTSD